MFRRAVFLLRLPGLLGRAWFRLTADEQKALVVILFVVLVGLAAKAWRVWAGTGGGA